jgi:transcriptional regulator with XRE-family HTH domain
MEIGQKIKKVRELRNLTQDYIASKIGMTQESYSKIESSRNNISIQKLEKIAEILEVNPSDLLNFDENRVLLKFENTHNNTQVGYFNEIESVKQLYEKMLLQKCEEIETLKQVYEKSLVQQRDEIIFLRSLLQSKS